MATKRFVWPQKSVSSMNAHLACVAGVSSRGSSRKLGQEQKNMNDGGGGGEGRNPLQPFFCFRSNFRAITRLETLATQANVHWNLGINW